MVENVEDLLRELKYVAKQYENEKLYTFEVSRKQMAEDCIKGITFLQTENAELKAQIEKIKLESDEHLKIVHKQLESLLKYAKDKGIVKSWFYNGTYHWECVE